MKKGCTKKKEEEGQGMPLGAKWCVDGGEGRVRKQGVAICRFFGVAEPVRSLEKKGGAA